jgi:hypothetical protein
MGADSDREDGAAPGQEGRRMSRRRAELFIFSVAAEGLTPPIPIPSIPRNGADGIDAR